MGRKSRKYSLLFEDIKSRYSFNSENLDYLKPVIDTRFYYYGDHFKKETRPTWKDIIASFIFDCYILFFSILQKFQKKDRVVFSNAYFQTDDELRNVLNCEVSRLPWRYNLNLTNRFDYLLYRKCIRIQNKLLMSNLTFLLSKEFAFMISSLKKDFKQFLDKNQAQILVLSNDEGFFERIIIDVAKELGIKTAASVHGLQFFLNEISWSKTDILLVWGELSKIDFVNNGFNADRIHVTGHPNHKILRIPKSLKFEFDDILVLTESLNGIRSNDDYTLTDRSNLIYYTDVIMQVLKSISINSARLRIHPSENIEFYRKNVDLGFYTLDHENLDLSLRRSSLVIGPTSTVFFDSLLNEVNYLIFQCVTDGVGINGYKIPAVYNGDNSKIPVALNSIQLRNILIKRKCVDSSVLHDLCAEKFSLSFLKKYC
jgi:hypothetical protein